MPNKKDEIENRFTAARHVMDDLCRAYYGMTWDEHERLHGGVRARPRSSRSRPGTDRP